MNYTPKHIYELVFRNDIVNLKIALSEGNNSKDGYRCSCGMMAIHTASARSKDCLSILLESGFDIEGRTAHNSTPLIISCCNKRRDCAELLLQHGAQIESKDENGSTALSAAASYHNLECVQLLLEKGANVNACDFRGWTVLDHCVIGGESNKTDCFKVVLEHGGISGRVFGPYQKEYKEIVHQRKAQFTSFIDTYVPFVPWRKLLRSRVFPRGSNPHVPDMGWVRADRLCDKFYHDEVFFLLQLIIAKVYATRLPSAITRMTRGMSKKCVSSIPQYLSRNSDKTHLLMELLSRELSEYLHFPK